MTESQTFFRQQTLAVAEQREKVRTLQGQMNKAAETAYDEESTENIRAFWELYKEFNIQSSVLREMLGV